MQSIQLATLNVDELRKRLRKMYNVPPCSPASSRCG